MGIGQDCEAKHSTQLGMNHTLTAFPMGTRKNNDVRPFNPIPQ